MKTAPLSVQNGWAIPMRSGPIPHALFSVLVVLSLLDTALGLTLVDLLVERSGTLLPDLAIDFLDRLTMLGAAVAASIVVLRLGQFSGRIDDLKARLESAAAEGRALARAQSRRFVEGLSQAIETQFDALGLTSAEADLAGLLLKGASQRDIAALCRTSEAANRQQASTAYRKRGLGSRAELSAYFREDLFALGETTISAAPRPRSPLRHLSPLSALAFAQSSR